MENNNNNSHFCTEDIKFSIIIPVYNVASFLRQGMDSIINQTYRNLDIICVDDGSSDDSYEILKEYASTDQRINLIHQENKGTVIARQIGVAAATGDWCLFFDPDDWLELETCQLIHDYIKTAENKADVIQYCFFVENCPSDTIKNNTCTMLNGIVPEINGSDTLLEECFINRSVAWNLIGKCYNISIAKKAFAAQEALEFSYTTDVYASFFLMCYSNRYQRLSDKELYHYRWGTGISTKSGLSLDAFSKALNLWSGYTSIKNFSNSQFPDSKTKNTTIPLEIESILMDATLNFALERMGKDVPVRLWAELIEQKTGKDVLQHLCNWCHTQSAAQKHLTNTLNYYLSYYKQAETLLENLRQTTNKQEQTINKQEQTINIQEQTIKTLASKKKKYKILFNVCWIILFIILVIYFLYTTTNH